jgi:hypothetical protein
MNAWRQGSAWRVVRHEAPPHEHAHVQPPATPRWTRGWWAVLVRMATGLLTSSRVRTPG